jgi:hypothetical protein
MSVTTRANILTLEEVGGGCVLRDAIDNGAARCGTVHLPKVPQLYAVRPVSILYQQTRCRAERLAKPSPRITGFL